METWPNFFIVGAPKAGTSSLYEYLRKIPGIYMSPVKEPKYFSKMADYYNDPHSTKIQDKKKYLDLFSKVKDEKIIGEASPSYLRDPDAPKLIHEISQEARILISLRDPVERIFSSYLMAKRRGKTKTLFHEGVQDALNTKMDSSQKGFIINAGLYTENVKSYLETFGEKQVKIIIFEEWILEPKKTIEEILMFLGVNYNLDDFKEEVYNPFGVSRGTVATSVLANPQINKMANKIISSGTKKFLKEKLLTKKIPKPKMDEKDRDILINFYREDVMKLQSLLGRALPWSNF